MEAIKKLGDCGVEIVWGDAIPSKDTLKSTDIPKEKESEYVKLFGNYNIGKDCEIDLSRIDYTTIERAVRKYKFTKIEDIVISHVYPFKVALIDKEAEGLYLRRPCVIIRINSGLDKAYLLAFLSSKKCKEQLSQYVRNPHIGLIQPTMIQEILVPVPLIEEQREIGNRFIEHLQSIKKLKELQKAEKDSTEHLFDNWSN